MTGKKFRLGGWIVGLLLAALAFAGGYLGGRAWEAYPFWKTEDWQETAAFENQLYQSIDRVMILMNSQYRLDHEELNYVERRQLEDSCQDQWLELQADHTWFRFQVRSQDGGHSYLSNAKGEVEEEVRTVHYAAFYPDHRVPGLGSTYDSAQDASSNAAAPRTEAGEPMILECGVPSVLQGDPEDEFSQLFYYSKSAAANFKSWAYEGGVLLLGAAACLLVLLILSGRRAAAADYVPGLMERAWLEAVVLVLGGGLVLAAVGLVLLEDWYHLSMLRWKLWELLPLASGGLVALAALLGTALLRTLVLRGCSHRLVKSTLLYRLTTALYQGGVRLLGVLPLLWRVLLLFGLWIGVSLLLFTPLRYRLHYILFWVAAQVLCLVWVCRWTLRFRELRDGARTIAAGNLNHRIDTAKMPQDLKDHGEALNNISQGLSGAVDEKMKSERFKAELITNVSHDLKTPLTSIISYVSLLKTTDQSDPKALEYIEVLDRKSQRLKKLTEDLVEASKASTGVLTVNREKIGMGQLLEQALGEWEEKLNERQLTVVTDKPETECWVYADGRHLWRVIDNLLSNCCKYAMSGTRVYLDLSRDRGQVTLSVKNISREPLNIPADRLMERFVRGEESRSTEGSGLGLSIARSLTELQGGTFSLSVDGDLFKAAVSLNQAA